MYKFKFLFPCQVNECHWASDTIGEMISLDDNESHQNVSKCANVPNEFFYDMESSWRGRVKGIHIEKEITQVEKSAEALSLAVSNRELKLISIGDNRWSCMWYCFCFNTMVLVILSYS